jgi:hypothetical protein
MWSPRADYRSRSDTTATSAARLTASSPRSARADALAAGIEWVLDPTQKPALDAAARQTAESRFDIRQCARGYRDLFADLIEARTAGLGLTGRE